LTTWHYILSAELTKSALLQTVFWRFCALGIIVPYIRYVTDYKYVSMTQTQYRTVRKCCTGYVQQGNECVRK